jgi:pimeloyl-ACP methyl ester carboxylesterase
VAPYPCIADQWKGQVPYLARHFRVITVEGRGNGRADRPETEEAYADREYVDDAIAALDATGADRAVVIGSSLGARHALQLAAWYPERAAGVVGIGPALVWPFPRAHRLAQYGAGRRVDYTGTWMIVEPIAGDRAEDNFNPLGRLFYGLSTLLCIPASLSQDVGLALGPQAGEARIRDVVTRAGLTRFRRASETLVSIVYEARP